MRSLGLMSQDPRQVLGKVGESAACNELRRLGYEILETRYRTRFGEIDIVARDGDTTVFVEVKTRSGTEFGDGPEAVTAWKRRRISMMALDYVSRQRLHDAPCRFDVVAVNVSAPGCRVEIYRHAFDAVF